MMAQNLRNLDTEVATYQRLLPTLAADEGKFAVIVGERLVGLFDAYADALAAGYKAAKLDAFLVKRISGIETVAYFSRDILTPCRTSQQ